LITATDQRTEVVPHAAKYRNALFTGVDRVLDRLQGVTVVVELLVLEARLLEALFVCWLVGFFFR